MVPRSVMRRLAHPLRVVGHPANPDRLYAADWVRSAILIFWAIGLGGFIATGPITFANPVYMALTETFHHTSVIGGSLALCGVLGMVGVWSGCRRLSKVSALTCAVWHGLFFSYTIPANFGLFGTANIISLFALVMCLLYLVQFLAISGPIPAGAIRR